MSAALTPSARRLCCQVAQERARVAIWRAGADLRAEAHARLAAGEAAHEVESWLRSEHAEALAQQARG